MNGLGAPLHQWPDPTDCASAVVSPASELPPRPRLLSTAQIETMDQRRLEQDLRSALPSGELIVHYQPRVMLDSGVPVGAEALVRWLHRKRGLVSPGIFIPIAEHCGLITDIGGWVMRTACVEAASWPGDSMVSVNVSAVQLGSGALTRQLAQALDASGLAPTRLELELTESMLVDAGPETLLTLSALRDRGISLALDDFGTGYASISTLKRLPLTALKLDRSLMQGLPQEREDVAIARALVDMAHALDLVVVAEGVATQAQRQCLVDLGCDQGQSYLFGRPMPAEPMRQQLADATAAPH